MSTTSDPRKALTIGLRDATHEVAYRRGVHQAFDFAANVADRANTLTEVKFVLERALRIVGELRYRRKREGNVMLLDYIQDRLSAPRRRSRRR
jgi:hypothetical protein